MKLLITGIAGFIGSSIARTALQRGYTVYGIDDLSQGYLSNVPKGATFLQLDIRNYENLHRLPRDIDYILHLAGQSSGEISFDNPVLDLEKNVVSTLNLIKFGIEKKIKKIFYASSMSVYGATEDRPISETEWCSPLSCYGVGKLTAEQYLKVYQCQLPYISFRMFNVYGPGQDLSNLRQGMVSIYLAQALTNNHILVKGSLSRFRDFIYIDDIVNVWLESLERQDLLNECLNLGTGIKTTVFELLSELKDSFPRCSWQEKPQTAGDQFGIYADMDKFKSFFPHIKFLPLKDGLKEFIYWAKK